MEKRKCIMCGQEHDSEYGSPLCNSCQGIATEASLNNEGIVIRKKVKPNKEI